MKGFEVAREWVEFLGGVVELAKECGRGFEELRWEGVEEPEVYSLPLLTRPLRRFRKPRDGILPSGGVL